MQIKNSKQKQIELKLRQILPLAAIGISLVCGTPVFAANGIASFNGDYEPTPVINQDPTKAVIRGYIVPSATAVAGGAKIGVNIYHNQLNSPVSLWLQIAINDGNGNVQVIALKHLSDKVADNATNYLSKREFTVSYQELNQELARLTGHSRFKVGPGTPLFVYARWDGPGHQWGGISRGGLVYMPGDVVPEAPVAGQQPVAGRRVEELDIAYNIPQTMANFFNDAQNNGLKVGGQIRSRLESEGKYQIPLSEVDKVKKHLFDLANDPVKAAALLGSEWTVAPQLRYMKKDASGQMILGADGLPIPDPMVDTYYDNVNYDAAKTDMAIRYRWTEGNQSGSWNFKPGMTHSSPENIVDRIEYGIDTTDDKPGTIAKFADSNNPLNPLNKIRTVIPGATPSDFLVPAVKITDTRYKFLLSHKSGLKIEISLDDAESINLRVPNSGTSKYVQIEMDIDHLATQSMNTATPAGGWVTSHLDDNAAKAFLSALGATAFVDGRPVIHEVKDLEATSPVKLKHDSEFKLANEAIVKLRDAVIGKDWLPGSQKYSLAAYALQLVDKKTGSPSVKKLLDAEKALQKNRTEVLSLFTVTGASCAQAFGN